MARENRSQYAMLALLRRGPLSGYDIKKRIGGALSYFWSESYGQIYPVLKQLTEAGLTTRTVEPQAGKPDRHVYALTEAGRSQLQRWLAEPIEAGPRRNELLLKLFCGDEVEPATMVGHLEAYRDQQAAELQRLEELQAELEQRAQRAEAQRYFTYQLITARYGVVITDALVAWCEESLQALSALDDADAAETRAGLGIDSQTPIEDA